MPVHRCLDCPAWALPGQPRCDLHRRRALQRRLSRQARGYGTDHDRARRQLLACLPCLCGYGCGTTLTAHTLVAAHRVDGHPEYGYLPACQPCNERAKRERGVVGG